MTAQLYETDGNPIPPNAHVGMLTMPDGKRLRYARFAAEARPLRGTVVILTGRNECIEKYFETIRDLSARGFGTAMFDLRGQGGSDRLIRRTDRGYIDSFDDYVADIDPFMRQIVLPDCRGPYYMLAHSTGGLIAMLAAPILLNRIERIVLSAPLLTLTGLPFSMRTLRRVANTLCAVGLGSAVIGAKRRTSDPTPFDGNKVTTDPARYARNVEIFRRHPELGSGSPTAAWLRAACLAVDRACDPAFMRSLEVPMLFVAAGNDEVVSTPLIEQYTRRVRSASLVTIDGARHELLQESDLYREQFLAAFDAFVPGSPTLPD